MTLAKKLQTKLQNPYNFLLVSFGIYFIFALIANTPTEILKGLYAIYTTSDVLISDYIAIGGLGAALVNSALVGIFCTLLTKHLGCHCKGTNIMSVWLMCGFAFFGKNLMNILPILLGGYLYCWFQKISFAENIVTIFLATTLAPIVTQFSFIGLESKALAIALGVLSGLLVGFIIIPVAKQTRKAHKGYNLYNVGFACGIIAIILTAVIRNLGFELETLAIWSEGNDIFLGLFLLTICLYMILGGFFVSKQGAKEYFKIHSFATSDATTHDYYQIRGEQSYLNIGILGIFSGLLVLLTGGSLNGPLMGGIFTIMGFAACGKDLLNIFPVIFGCCVATLANGWSLSSPGIMLAILFSTTLAPIANEFGFLWGTLAGFLHLNTVSKLSAMHGGLSLYNNGLAGGLVATMLVPIIIALRESPRMPKRVTDYIARKKEKRTMRILKHSKNEK